MTKIDVDGKKVKFTTRGVPVLYSAALKSMKELQQFNDIARDSFVSNCFNSYVCTESDDAKD